MMKYLKRAVPWFIVVPLLMVVLAAAGCGGSDAGGAAATTDATTATTASDPGGGPASGDTVLEVRGPAGEKAYSLDEIKGMAATEGYGGIKTSTGRITPPMHMKGVSVIDLFAEVGGLPEDMAVSIVAKDGYEMTLSYDQLNSGEFLTYDMVTGDEKQVAGPLTMSLAYEADGEPLNPESWGTLRLAIVGPEREQVTDGHWWVKWVVKLEAKPIEEEWSLLLVGHLTEEIDRPTFQTGAAQGCHGRDWTDAAGDIWTGIPLYLLCGWVDDDNSHEGPAYNRELATAGYEVEITGEDGAKVTVGSDVMYYNKDLIVAYRLNGEALPEEYRPLRLVGEGIEDDQSVGQIREIKLLLPDR
jgi:DMSO/TMAO reductase YedYZ molybdopterin-dependent catalytic subunit